MPRSGSGTFTLVSGNPVVTGTTIESTWANNTLSDIATAMTDSLSRSGQGGMTAAFRAADGSSSVPGVSWSNETGTGFYRAGAGDTRFVVSTTEVQKWLSTGTAITGTLSATGDLGVGAAAPVFGSGSGVEIQRAGIATLRLENSSASNSFELYADSAANGINLRGRDSSPMVFWTANTEKMRLDSSGNLGIGTSSPTGGRLHVSQSSGSAIFSSTAGGTGYGGSFENTDGGTTKFVRAAGSGSNGVFSAGVGATTHLLLDTSGNLGIGTSSPVGKLDVRSGYVVSGTGPSTDGSKILGGYYTSGQLATFGGEYSNGGPVIGYGVWPSTTAAGAFVSSTTINATRGAYSIVGNAHVWYAGAAQTVAIDSAVTTSAVMTLDGSGNLGLGVTPSAWSGGFKAMQYPGGSIASYASGTNLQIEVGNAYYQSSLGTYTYYNTGTAPTLYRQLAGEHRWLTAPSGTAGNAITFTQAMTLDASGNLGIGQTPAVRKFEINAIPAAVSQLNGIRLQASGVATSASELLLGTDGTGVPYTSLRTGNDGNGYMTFFTGSGPTERARITSGGNLRVGLTGDVTSADNRLGVEGTRAIDAKSTGGATAPTSTLWNNATTGDNIFESFRTETTDTQRGTIDYNRAGGLVRYNTTSDYRAKDIIGPVQDPGATIDALKVYEGVMKGATQSRPMLIAHEAQAHAPYAVSGVKDEVNEDGTPKFQQMDVSSLVPLLLAEIQSLRARVAALEAA